MPDDMNELIRGIWENPVTDALNARSQAAEQIRSNMSFDETAEWYRRMAEFRPTDQQRAIELANGSRIRFGTLQVDDPNALRGVSPPPPGFNMEDVRTATAQRQLNALFLHEASIRRSFQQMTGATDPQLAQAEAKLVSQELERELAQVLGVAVGDGVDARIIGPLLLCHNCQDGWVEVPGEEGEYELCECAYDPKESEPVGESGAGDPLGYGVGRLLAGRGV